MEGSTLFPDPFPTKEGNPVLRLSKRGLHMITRTSDLGLSLEA